MKHLSFCVFAVLMVACSRPQDNAMVSQTFYHKYGVPVKREEWLKNGQSGMVTETFTNGVSVTRSYKGGVLDGETLYTFPNTSTIATKESFRNGILMTRTTHYESGIPYREEQFNQSQLVRVRGWYETGTPSLLEHYQNGSLLRGEYFTLDNMVAARVEGGNGERLLRNTEGDLLHKDTIERGKVKERITFLAGGDPASVTTYLNDEIHGTRLTFLPGGVPATVENWSHGKQEGLTIVYHNGLKYAEIPYVAGEKQGVEIRYRDGKEVAEEVTWRRGVQHGPRKVFAGQTTKIQWYHQGELVSRPTYKRLNVR